MRERQKGESDRKARQTDRRERVRVVREKQKCETDTKE